MSNEFEDFAAAPTLTLEPFPEAKQEVQPAPAKEEPALDDSILSEEEKKAVDAFVNQIDLTNSSLILQYGAGT